MSELGSNKGQDEDKNTPIFDSSELEAKQKADHFANIEDVEARKKEAERKTKAAEKKAEEEHRSAVKAVAKKADKEARGSKGGIWNLLFGGWHKWVTIVVLMVVLSVIGAVCYFSKNGTISEQQAEKKVESFKESCSSESLESGYCFNALEDLEKYISNEKNLDTKVGLLKEYEKYVMSEYGDAGRVKNFLDDNVAGDYSEENKQALCDIYKALYYESDNWEEYVKDCEL